jgi:S-sulfo-L-cysteine synthase (O-acetyl-L-serine-dependent)
VSREAPILGSISEAAGNTPLVRLYKIEEQTHGTELWAKLEFMNPGGSVKDRPALQMILDAEAKGLLKPGMSLVDSTSGNTGVALALYGAARGYRVTLVMPENVSSARKNMLRAFGAEIVYSDPMDGSDGAIRLVRQMVSDEPDRFFYTNQYANPSNPRSHYLHTAEEILRELGPRLTHFVAGVGTSGTVMGNGRRLREYSDRIQIIGVEPDDEFHGLEGLKHIRTSIVPDIYDASVLHRTIFLETDRGWNVSELLADREGLLVGHSAGAAVAAAMIVADELHAEGKTGVIACVLPDHASRYVEVKS